MKIISSRKIPSTVGSILFDLDGTLVDSKADLVDSVNQALLQHGWGALPEEQVIQGVGSGARYLVETALLAAGGPKEETDSLFKTYTAIYRENHCNKTCLYPGVHEILEILSRQGIPMAVVSNKPYEFTLSLLRHFKIDPLFQAVYGGDSLPVRKPHPGPFYAAIKDCKAIPAESILVGDGEHDMAAGKEGGIYAVGATYGFRAADVLIEAGADALIDSVAELKELLPELLR